MGDRDRRSGPGESGGELWPSQRADLPEVHTSQRQRHSGNAVVARTGSSAERTVCGTSFTRTIEGGAWVMRKLIAVGVLVGGLLAGAGSAMAQTQGGIGDPLTLAASGVLIPYLTAGGTVALLEVASPVSNNPNLHMQFYDANCNKIGPSVGMPLTTNDIAFQPVGVGQGGVVPAGVNGLVAISAVAADGFTNAPLESPIHSRMYLFNASDGQSRVLEPVILDTAEFSGPVHWWSPMRTAVTFFSPLVTASVHTRLILVCPDSNIQGGAGGYFTDAGFPIIDPPFPPHSDPFHQLRARIYDTNEAFKRNTFTTCRCLTQLDLEDPAAIDAIYSNAGEVPFGTYTELEEVPIPPATRTSSFTGYRSIFTVGSPLNNFFGRLSNGNRTSIQGAVNSER